MPKEKSKRPTISEVLSFLESALVNDVPVAFLNLCNGDEKNLDRWHWVTIVSLDYSSDGKSAFIVILDEGMIKKINFAL